MAERPENSHPDANGRVPLPPDELIRIAGAPPEAPVRMRETYLEIGAGCKATVLDALGTDWSWDDKRMLDFGCGAGRLLRHLIAEAETAEIFGSDVDPAPVAWVEEHLCPPVAGATVNGFDPPLGFPDDHFDLVTAFSVFTHLGTNWADWLLEIRRVLKPDGVLIATILDQSFSEDLTGIPYVEEEVGMSIFGQATPGMPYVNVVHSHWWIREHWGRAFEILSLTPGEFSHGTVVLRPREGDLSVQDLEIESAEDPRYLAARRHQQELFAHEAGELRSEYEKAMEELAYAKRIGPLAKLIPSSARRSLRERFGRG